MRKVKMASIAQLFVQEIKNGHTISGLIVILISVSLLILLSAYSSWIHPHNYNDLQNLKEKGIRTEATITALKIYEQIRINGRSPKVITYDYFIMDEFRSDHLWTLDRLEHGIGEEVKIIVYEEKSIIEDVQPFIIPVRILIYIPYFYLGLGVAFVFIGMIPFFKKYNLYKHGRIKDASVISIYPQPSDNLEEYIWVNYTYKAEDEKLIYGRSKIAVKHLPTQSSDKAVIFVSNKNEENSCLIPWWEIVTNH